MGGARWSDSDIAELRRLADNKLPPAKIAEKLNRSERSVINKASHFNIVLYGGQHRQWSAEELRSLRVDWNNPKLSAKMLCKKYSRTLASIRSKAYSLGLGERPYDYEYISLSDIAKELGVTYERVWNWVGAGLKCKKLNTGKLRYLVLVDDLLDFLETHKATLKSCNISEHIFAVKPDWLRDATCGKVPIRKNHRRYTSSEDAKIVSYYKRGKSLVYIAEALNRTPRGIKGRLERLGVSSKKPSYTSEEDATILKLRDEGKTYREIAEALNRTTRGIEAKAQRLKRCSKK